MLNIERLSIMNSEGLLRAVETYDHLLWEAVARVCGVALSQAFAQDGGKVRVVYKTCHNDPHFWPHGGCPDPRGHLRQIEGEVAKLASLCLPIQKLGKKLREAYEAEQLCSRIGYKCFLQNTVPFSQEYLVTHASQLRLEKSYDCDFVEFGFRGEEGHICCPCIGEHLTNTKDLRAFKIDLQEPRRVGKDAYEFRFEIASA